MKKLFSALLGLAACGAFLAPAGAQTPPAAPAPSTPVIQINADRVKAQVNPMLYGIMTEEINHSYDGGLYAELIQNRTFKDTYSSGRGGRGGRGARAGAPDTTQAASAPTPPAPPATPTPVAPHWSVVTSTGAQGTIALDTADPVNATALSTSLRLDIATVPAAGRVGVANDGFWGIPVKPNTTYNCSFYARANSAFSGPLTVSIESDNSPTVFATATVPALTARWQQYKLTLRTAQVTPTANARFIISAASRGSVWFNLVSLFPPTFNNRPNGNRIDISELLRDLRPAFLRFPGGNYLEGNSFADRFAWKNTIGPLEERSGHMAPWTYRSSDGLGLYEYLMWCEELKMEPVLAVFAGHILGRANTVVTGPELEPYVQEALEEIEYVIGDTSTKWGAQRAKNGHPAPFKLTYVEVGNEENLSAGEATFEERFTAFANAIRGKYPQLKLIAAFPSTVRNHTRITPPDVVDDHYYFNSVPRALAEAHHYDNFDRNGPKVFVGEWATRIGDPTPTMHATLGDAAFLTGLERNADVIIMSGYAPLLTNVNAAYTTADGIQYPRGQQWSTDLIGYDALTAFGSASYYMQKMFSENLGDIVPESSITGVPTAIPAPTPPRGGGPAPVATPPGTATATLTGTAPARGAGPAQAPVDQLFYSVTRSTARGTLYLKVVNVQDTPQTVRINITGIPALAPEATRTTLTAANLTDVNSVAEPKKVFPVTFKVQGIAPTFDQTFAPNSVTVLQIDQR